MRRVLLGVAVGTLLAAGCGQATNPQIVLQSGPRGINTSTGDILIRAARIQAPAQVSYPPGSNATVWLTLLNQAPQPDALVGVSTPDADRVEIRWDRNCDGSADLVPQLPLAPVNRAPTSVAAPPFAGYHLVIVGWRQQVLAGTSVPVTMRFAHTPTLHTRLPVEPSNAKVPDPSLRCEPVSGATPSR